MTTASKIAYNAAAAIGARVTGTAFAFISVAVIARTLGANLFGQYTLILSFLFTFQVLADGGLYSLLLREISKPDVDASAVASTITTLRIILLLAVLGAAPFVVWALPYTTEIPLGVAIAAIGFFFLSLSQLLMAIFQKTLRVTYAAIAEVAGRGAQLGAVLVAVALGGSLFHFLWALVVGAVVQWALNMRWAQQLIPIRFQIDGKQWRYFLREAAPIAVSLVFTMIYFRIDSIFLSLPSINSSAADPLESVGHYGVAYKVLEALIFYPAMFVGLLMPFLSRYARRQYDRFVRVFRTGGSVLLVVVAPMVAGLLLYAEPIVTLVGGEAFQAAAPILQVLSVAIGVIFFGSLFGNALIAREQQRQAAWIYAGGAIINVIANILVIPQFQAAGAAMTTVLTEVVVTVGMGFVLWRSDITISLERLPAVLGATAGMLAVLYLLRPGFALGVGVGVLSYGALLVLFRGITKDEFLLLVGRRSNLESL